MRGKSTPGAATRKGWGYGGSAGGGQPWFSGQMRADLQAERDAFTELQLIAEESGSPVTKLRILDILVWRATDSWQ